MHRFFRKNRYAPRLDSQAANEILSNVFDACHTTHNTVPLETLESYSHYRRERFTFQRMIIIVVLIAFFVLPLFFIPPTFTVSQGEEDNNKYEVRVQSILPVRRITAVINGSNVPVYETDNNLYSIEPTGNGTMTITVESVNNCSYSEEIEVSSIDNSAPVLLSSDHDGSVFTLYLSDADSGIDYDNLSAYDTSGQEVEPISIDEESACVSYAYPEDSLNIYIPDKAGNQLHLLVSLK